MAEPYDWLDDLSPENVDKIFDLEVIAEYPLGDSFVLTYFSGRPMEHMVLFDGSNEGVEVRGSWVVIEFVFLILLVVMFSCFLGLFFMAIFSI